MKDFKVIKRINPLGEPQIFTALTLKSLYTAIYSSETIKHFPFNRESNKNNFYIVCSCSKNAIYNFPERENAFLKPIAGFIESKSEDIKTNADLNEPILIDDNIDAIRIYSFKLRTGFSISEDTLVKTYIEMSEIGEEFHVKVKLLKMFILEDVVVESK